MAAQADAPLFLGLDLSTQQLKAVLVTEDESIVHESSVHFDNDLPSYKTTNGAIRGPAEGEVTSPVAMWIESLDLLMDRMKAAGVNFRDIVAVSGAGQQHGSVYWSTTADLLLKNLDPSRSLTEQLADSAFSLPNAPIWQDSSTATECSLLEESIGGAQALADVTGSRAYERFTGSQIAKISRLHPEEYKATSRISLVSSFVASLFLGAIAPIEVSDASGMNLMNVLTCKWEDRLLQTCGGPELRAKLGPEPVHGGTNLGKVASWWVQRWGFNPECIVAPFTGDNPASIVALATPGDAILSLGTSTTFLLSIPSSGSPPKRTTTSHLLSHPTNDGQIAMLCYKNGALVREQIRDVYAEKSWDRFNELVEASPAGNSGALGFYFPLPEIIPPGVKGEYYFTTDESGGVSRVEKIPDEAHPRAILESQFLSILSRVEAILPAHHPHLKSLIITGGSSANHTIRQLAADVFDMKVYVSSTKEAAGLGGAILAKYAWWRTAKHEGTLEDMTGGKIVGLRCVAEPRPEVVRKYQDLVDVYVRAEEIVVTEKLQIYKVAEHGL